MAHRVAEPWRPGDAVVPVFAILGWPRGADVGILGAGTLISSRHLLTADHVVRSDRTLPYRAYSPVTGVVGVERIVDFAPDTGLKLVELERDSELPPLGLKSATDCCREVEAWGFGGGEAGILQRIRCSVNPGGKQGINLDRHCLLGKRDSGAPLIVGGCLIGLYTGIRFHPSRPDGTRSFERLAVSVAPNAAAIKKAIKGTTPAKARTLEQLPVKCTTHTDREGRKQVQTIEAFKWHNHEFSVQTGERSRLVVAVNATSMPLRSRSRLVAELWYRKGGARRYNKVDVRRHPGPFQAFRSPLGNGWRWVDNSGSWRVRIRSELELTYQISATLFR